MSKLSLKLQRDAIKLIAKSWNAGDEEDTILARLRQAGVEIVKIDK